MNRILDWAEANMKPNLWALLLFAVLLRSGYQFHEIQKPTQWMGAILVILLLALFGAVALRGFARSVASAVRRSSSAGFTLIEIAIVLVVVGLIASTSLSFLGRVGDGRKQSETNVKIAEIERALMGFVIQNGCVPCPADATALTNRGQQIPNTTPCDAAGCTNATGVVPWVTLGLSEDVATDGWNRLMTFSIANELHTASSQVTPSGLTRSAAGTFPANIVTNAQEIRIEQPGGLQIEGGETGDFVSPYDLTATQRANKDYAYVIVSHGADGSFGFTSSGSQVVDQHGQAAGATDVGQHENGDGDRTFATGNFNLSNGVGFFDDIVVYKGSHSLIMACGSGSCGNP
jgi:prepilin-type N-terminal cleavage/methylation domain-containing protein